MQRHYPQPAARSTLSRFPRSGVVFAVGAARREPHGAFITTAAGLSTSLIDELGYIPFEREATDLLYLSDLATLRSREPCADDKSRVRTMDAGLSRCDGRAGLLDDGERKGSEMR